MTELNTGLCQTVKVVGLAKLFLWPEAERIQTYPEAFANLIADRVYTRRDIASDVFGLVYKDDETTKPVRGNQIENCFGLEIVSDEKIIVRGINALRQVAPDRFEATKEAMAIGQTYKTNQASEDEWAIPLARQITRFEVRTRLLLYLLGRGKWCLTFATPEFYAYPSVRATLIRGDETLSLYQDSGTAFNHLLQEQKHVALGPWWKAELGLLGYAVEDEFQFAGIRGDLPSTNNLSYSLKSGLFLMKYLDVLESDGGGWVVSPVRAAEILGQDIARDFVEIPDMDSDQSPLAILKHLVNELEDDAGLVIVSHLARNWAGRSNIPPDEAEIAFDRFIRQQLYEGTVRVTLRHQGQLRHGRGLFGDQNARKIRLEFTKSSYTESPSLSGGTR